MSPYKITYQNVINVMAGSDVINVMVGSDVINVIMGSGVTFVSGLNWQLTRQKSITRKAH